MGKQTILRPCFNRPEMFQLSLEAEINARKYFDIGEDLHTLFIIEYGAPPIIEDLIKKYPYDYSVIKREQRFGLSVNILEGMKVAFSNTDSWIIYIEDDILLHETYFKYIKTVLNMKELNNYSVISPCNFNDIGDVHVVRMDRHYAALAPLISKDFYEKYILHCSDKAYYTSHALFVVELNKKYEAYHHDRTYRFKDSAFNQQAGLINRLCDVVRIEEGKYVVMPDINRMQHIGIYGHNRSKGQDILGNTFEARLESLRDIITDPKKMYDMAGSKQYNDYKIFSPKLKDWDGTLKLADKHFTS